MNFCSDGQGWGKTFARTGGHENKLCVDKYVPVQLLYCITNIFIISERHFTLKLFFQHQKWYPAHSKSTPAVSRDPRITFGTAR